MNKVWVINGANGDVEPGNYRCRLVRQGPWVPVTVRESADGYQVTVDGREVEDYMAEFPQGLFGILEEEFQARTVTDTASLLEKKIKRQLAEPIPAPSNRLTVKLPF